ncbi:MAG: histone deacetylase family protein [Pseudomonadota bacterium]
MTTAWLTHESCRLHDMGAGHPECPQRLDAIETMLRADAELGVAIEREEAPEASLEQLERVHDPRYVAAIVQAAPERGLRQLDPDTAMNPHSLSAARHAAGAVVRATDRVVAGEVANAFCPVRPPGHHAEYGRPMGFCIFNGVATGAAHALAAHGLDRVAIVDFDVHHGNGTEDIFRDEPRVMMVSTFQHPLYPYSGVDGRGERMVNVPLSSGADGRALRAAVEREWLPAFERFQPQMLFISAGFDAHRDDPLAGLGWVEDDYAWVTRQLMAVADRHCAGRIVSVLEGGYNLEALARSVRAHVRVLAGLPA